MLPYSKTSNQYKAKVTAVTNFLTSGCVPIYTVDKPAFKSMLKAMDERFDCPGRNYFSRTAIPAMYASAKTALVDELKHIPYLSITTDGWSSVARDPYISLTTHYISSDFELKSKCLETMYAPESHTADNIAQFVRNGLREFDLTLSKVVTITTDSAANMVAMGRGLGVTRLPCFGHVLHNAVSHSLDTPEISELLRACRRIVSVFSYSHKYRSGLNKVQKELNLPSVQLVNDVCTRWGSKLKMMERMLQQLPAVDKLFSPDRKYRDYVLSFHQQDLLETVVNALQPYREMTDLLSGDSVVTSSSVSEMLVVIRDTCRIPEEDETEDMETAHQRHLEAHEIRCKVWNYINSRYTDNDVTELLAKACVLDRRYEYSPPTESWPSLETVKNLLVADIQAVVGEATKTRSNLPSASDTSTSNTPSIASILMRKRKMTSAAATVEPEQRFTANDVAKREMEFFLSLSASIHEDILPFWKKHQPQFPHISQVARRILSMCATSVASERLFSLSGNIVSRKRNALKPQTVNMLVFLAFNKVF